MNFLTGRLCDVKIGGDSGLGRFQAQPRWEMSGKGNKNERSSTTKES